MSSYIAIRKGTSLELFCDEAKVGVGCFDTDDNGSAAKEIWLLEVESDHTKERKWHKNLLAGLLLESRRDSEDTFERVGFAVQDEGSTAFCGLDPRMFFMCSISPRNHDG